MLKNQRQDEILSMLREERYLSVHELSGRLFASLPTVRRDLAVLEGSGLVKSCYGGVTLYEGNETSPVLFRRSKKSVEKGRMGKLAGTLVKTGDFIYADASSGVMCIPVG